MPSAYKDAEEVKQQIMEFELATIVDEIRSYGYLMAGDWEQHVPWRRKKQAKQAARLAAQDEQSDNSALVEE
ncbi:hypothetical protein [Hymenobacter persicinus]|uniref:hypothetical protein n=1 Tax=Hymenobacter persicinus TaxID=2025506 RepID=UPI001A90F539|nr:hypothetical protein [Hymenobacter persicinus]